MESNVYITSYWQSLDLMQAGVDRETADYVHARNYEIVNLFGYYERKYIDGYHVRQRTDVDCFNFHVIPAWSLGCLWELAKEYGLVYDYSTNDSVEDVIESIVSAIKVEAKKLKDAKDHDI